MESRSSQRYHQPARSTLTNAERAYYGAFALSTIICWSPWKALAYLAPVLVVVWFLWKSQCRTARQRAMLWVMGWITMIVAYWAFSRSFDLAPAVLTIVTYGTVGTAYIIPSEAIGSPKLLTKMLSLLALVMAAEGTIGIAQAVIGALQGGSFDLANGDAVQGTISLSFHPSLTFANPMFAVNMGFMLIGLVAAATVAKKWRGTVLLGLVAFVLASVMHAIFLLAAAAFAGYILCRPRLSIMKSKKFIIATVCVCAVMTYLFLGENISSIGSVIRQALFEQSPRAIVLADSMTALPQEFPSMPFIGLGPGQFSSNAALLASGTYFGGGDRSLPLVQPQSSTAFNDFLYNLVTQARDPIYGGSITVEPFFSWLSIYTEFGLPCLVGVFLGAILVVLRIRKRAIDTGARLLGAAVIAGVVFFVLLGSQADYWEVPQAVLLGTLLTKAMYATLVSTPKQQIEIATRKKFGTHPQLA